MSRVGPTTTARLLALRAYLVARKVEVVEDENTGRGLAGFVATLDLVLRSHDGREDALDLPECLDVSGLSTTLPRLCGNRARRFDPHALSLPKAPSEAVDAPTAPTSAPVAPVPPDAPTGHGGAFDATDPDASAFLTAEEVERDG
jgi:hypothetical protein